MNGLVLLLVLLILLTVGGATAFYLMKRNKNDDSSTEDEVDIEEETTNSREQTASTSSDGEEEWRRRRREQQQERQREEQEREEARRKQLEEIEALEEEKRKMEEERKNRGPPKVSFVFRKFMLFRKESSSDNYKFAPFDGSDRLPLKSSSHNSQGYYKQHGGIEKFDDLLTTVEIQVPDAKRSEISSRKCSDKDFVLVQYNGGKIFEIIQEDKKADPVLLTEDKVRVHLDGKGSDDFHRGGDTIKVRRKSGDTHSSHSLAVPSQVLLHDMTFNNSFDPGEYYCLPRSTKDVDVKFFRVSHRKTTSAKTFQARVELEV